MYKTFEMTMKNGKVVQVTDFPHVAKQMPCPWDDNKYARVMIPYNKVEQRNHKHPRQHIQIVSRSRLRAVQQKLKVS